MRVSKSVYCALFVGFLLTSSQLQATNFSSAANSVLQSNNSGARAMYFGLLSLENDSQAQVYYAWINMVAARNAALTAYQRASAGYTAEATADGLSARSNTYNDWLYKNRAAAALYRTYLYGRSADTLQSISNGYLALLFTGRAAYFTGLASEGGVK
jgi:hypothetical protein